MSSIAQLAGIDPVVAGAQIASFTAAVLFLWAAFWILRRGRGWQVFLWLLLALLIPIVVPIIAILYFRRREGLHCPSES